MARKKRTPAQVLLLPLSKGEIWEVGRRALDVSVVDLARKGERPEVLLVVQAGDEGGWYSEMPLPPVHLLQSWWILSSAPCVSHCSESHVDQKSSAWARRQRQNSSPLHRRWLEWR